MTRRPAEPNFPFVTGAVMLTLTGVVLAAAGWGVAGGLELSPADRRSVLVAVGLVWAVAVGNLAILRRIAPLGGRAVAMSHYFGAAVRLLALVVGGLIAAEEAGLSQQTLLVTIAAAYLPMLIVDSVIVARFIRRHASAEKKSTHPKEDAR